MPLGLRSPSSRNNARRAPDDGLVVGLKQQFGCLMLASQVSLWSPPYNLSVAICDNKSGFVPMPTGEYPH